MRHQLGLGTMIKYSCVAGTFGIAAMLLSEKLEQIISSRPNSFVPADSLAALLHFNPNSEFTRILMNHTMQLAVGIGAAFIRLGLALNGIGGPFASFMFAPVRLLFDQSLENLSGVGSPPWTWPVNEQILDIVHKSVYAFTTGYLIDVLIM